MKLKKKIQKVLDNPENGFINLRSNFRIMEVIKQHKAKKKAKQEYYKVCYEPYTRMFNLVIEDYNKDYNNRHELTIESVIKWMNTYDMLRDTHIPIRFKEYFQKSKKLFSIHEEDQDMIKAFNDGMDAGIRLKDIVLAVGGFDKYIAEEKRKEARNKAIKDCKNAIEKVFNPSPKTRQKAKEIVTHELDCENIRRFVESIENAARLMKNAGYTVANFMNAIKPKECKHTDANESFTLEGRLTDSFTPHLHYRCRDCNQEVKPVYEHGKWIYKTK